MEMANSREERIHDINFKRKSKMEEVENEREEKEKRTKE